MDNLYIVSVNDKYTNQILEYEYPDYNKAKEHFDKFEKHGKLFKYDFKTQSTLLIEEK